MVTKYKSINIVACDLFGNLFKFHFLKSSRAFNKNASYLLSKKSHSDSRIWRGDVLFSLCIFGLCIISSYL